MLIPIFVSCPTTLNEQQESSRQLILKELKQLRLEPRALGRSDYPTDCPLREVYVIAKHCSGGVVLGFEQFQATAGISKQGTNRETVVSSAVKFPTPWNNLEAGILFGLKIPLLVFKEDGVTGGVFDNGVTDAFVHAMPLVTMDRTEKRGLSDVFLKWQAKVREHYYQ
jgi:hypothetical protein